MIKVLDSNEIKVFQKQIFSWYHINKRDLPWRQTRDPYKIFISEVMSQQTQLSRVISKYKEWMRLFPNINKLAKASNAEVLQAWSGLGYNRRALYIKKTAEIIALKYNSSFPRSIDQLKMLPGIGEYTARAIACFAFNMQYAVVDTNVRRVIFSQFHTPTAKLQVTNKQLQQIADQLLPKDKAYEWNQALMDYASLMLKEYKIPIPKQSKFRDSNRFYRGKIIKVLLRQKTISLFMLKNAINYSAQSARAPLTQIVRDMVKDGLIVFDNGIVALV